MGDPNSPNHVYIDNLSDRDSIVMLMQIISRIFPYSDSSFECSDLLTQVVKTQPSIIIGGMGYENNVNNHFAKEVIEAKNIPLSYKDNHLKFYEKVYNPNFDSSNKKLLSDIGVFLRIKSPFNPQATIFSIQGIHTTGVLGAVQAFGLSSEAYKNHILCNEIAKTNDFIAIFPVDVVDGKVITPILSEEYIHML